MTSTLLAPDLTATLDRILTRADEVDAPQLDRARAEIGSLDDLPPAAELADRLADVAMPVCAEVGRLLYQLVRLRPAPTVVEFGTSFAVSTLYLAAAVADGGTGGRVVTAELNVRKAATARANLAAAGVGAFVDVRTGDALETLDDPDLDGIDVLFLDGWNDLYLPVLRLLEPRLAPGAVVVADDLLLFPEMTAAYLDHVRDPGHGYVSVEVPIDDGLEVSTWMGR